MDARRGIIYKGTPAEIKTLERAAGRPFIPLSREQADELEPLGGRARKNNMRNKPCICGSGKKFKRCCWSKYE